jgi:hypothetical protein
MLIISTLSVGSQTLSRTQTFKAMMTQMPQQHQIGIVAQTMQRESAGTHATGNVHVRITPNHPMKVAL